MSKDDDQPDKKRRKVPTNIRHEQRHKPYKYMPETFIYPEDGDEEPIEGVTREESKGGFSASFDMPFPYEEGDIVDVRVGYQRAWAEVVWTINVLDKKVLAGFRLHPKQNVNDDEETTD